MYLLLGQLRLMDADGFRNLLSNGDGGIQRRHRVLKHIGEQLSPELSHILFRVFRNIYAVCPDLTCFDFGGFWQQLHDCLAEHTLSAAGFAHDGQHLAGMQRKAHIPDSMNLSHGGINAYR